jgi:hypothetical protein
MSARSVHASVTPVVPDPSSRAAHSASAHAGSGYVAFIDVTPSSASDVAPSTYVSAPNLSVGVVRYATRSAIISEMDTSPSKRRVQVPGRPASWLWRLQTLATPAGTSTDFQASA